MQLKAILIMLFWGSGLIWHLPDQGLHFNISTIRNQQGVIRLAFFTDDKSFKEERPKFERIASKSQVKQGKLTVLCKDIPAGRYGVALLDDENNDGKMDFRFCVPTEGFGFSGYYHKGLNKPSWDQFAFDFDGKNVNITIKIRYLQ